MPIKVPLGRSGLAALIDEQDAALVVQYRWTSHPGRLTSYAGSFLNENWLLMHRLLMRPADEMVVDHINGNGLDNRRCNLRICTPTQNKQNRGMSSNNASGFKGVYLDRNKYRAELIANGRRYRSLRFPDAKTAALAYDDLARRHHGEFARLNFPNAA